MRVSVSQIPHQQGGLRGLVLVEIVGDQKRNRAALVRRVITVLVAVTSKIKKQAVRDAFAPPGQNEANAPCTEADVACSS